MAGLSKTKTKPNPKLKFELKFGAELCNSVKSLDGEVAVEMPTNLTLYKSANHSV